MGYGNLKSTVSPNLACVFGSVRKCYDGFVCFLVPHFKEGGFCLIFFVFSSGSMLNTICNSYLYYKIVMFGNSNENMNSGLLDAQLRNLCSKFSLFYWAFTWIVISSKKILILKNLCFYILKYQISLYKLLGKHFINIDFKLNFPFVYVWYSWFFIFNNRLFYGFQ